MLEALDLEGQILSVGALQGVLNRHGDRVPILVQTQVDVFRHFLGFGDSLRGELNQCGIGIRKVIDLHSLPFFGYRRSKNAL